jgi:hypothetical protein
MPDFTKVPASIYTTDQFPELTDCEVTPELPEETKRLSRIIDHLFTKTPEGKAKDHDCLIDGWNGEYISALQGWDDGWNLGINPQPEAAHLKGKLQIPTFRARVSDDFASADIHIRVHKNHDNNPISAMGTYIIPIVQSKSGGLSVLVDKRGNTPLYPHKWNSPGTAIPADQKHRYVEAVTERTAKKYRLNLDPAKVRPLGILLDNVYHITLPSGWTVIDDQDVESTDLRQVPVKSLADFLHNEAPIEQWNFPGFLGLCEALMQFGDTPGPKHQAIKEYANALKFMEYRKLQDNPLKVYTALQTIEMDAIRNGRSLIAYFADMVELPEQTL